MIEISAPLSSSFLMMERELPFYLSTAYSLQYGNQSSISDEGTVKKILTTIQRYISLVKELCSYRPRRFDFVENIRKLDNDFQRMREAVAHNTKPICAYFVSSYDSNGAILGNHLYFYHHYKIRNFEKDYAVAPKVVRSQSEIKEFLADLKAQHPQREIKVVDIVAHGSESALCIYHPSSEAAADRNGSFINSSNLQNAMFEDCAHDAAIILDACSTGRGTSNIANEMAKKNPGKTVFAPGPPLFFSKPVISTASGAPKIEHVVHGFAIFNAYSFKRFHYPHAMPVRQPFTKVEHLFDDLFKFFKSPLLYSSRFASFPAFKSEGEKNNIRAIFQSLSPETQALIKHQVWKNNGEPLDRGDDFGGDFLKANPLHETVLSAFREVYADLKEDLFDYDSSFFNYKIYFYMIDTMSMLAARAHQIRTFFSSTSIQNATAQS